MPRRSERAKPQDHADGDCGPETADGTRAALSDARRSILHRQELDALAVLVAKRDEAAVALAAQSHSNLLLRADLLELAALKQSREIASVRDGLMRHVARVERLALGAANGSALQPDDPRHVDTLNARLEALELWVQRSAASPPLGA